VGAVAEVLERSAKSRGKTHLFDDPLLSLHALHKVVCLSVIERDRVLLKSLDHFFSLTWVVECDEDLLYQFSEGYSG
jgi:hypothetical protein